MMGALRGKRSLAPPHPEEPADASAKAGISKDEVASTSWLETRCFVALLVLAGNAFGAVVREE